MKTRKFLISGLVMAGIAPVSTSHAAPDPGPGASGPDPDDGQLVKRFALEHRFLLAQHRSHSSHASHGSHRSGSGGGYSVPSYTPPAPVYRPRPPRTPRATPAPRSTPSRNERSTPPQSILPSSPRNALLSETPTAAQIKSVIRKVQIALLARGYYRGALDGVSGPETRAALVRFQTDSSLSVTGTITAETLDALGIAAS